MLAIMPGFVNYFYKDGKLPAHTDSSFYQYGILTIHGIIVKNAATAHTSNQWTNVKNALLFMHNSNQYPSSLPQLIRETVPDNASIEFIVFNCIQ